ncbi:MAG TPA: biosynthetic peptidoglycan transglycosylase [Streptosporangiaceae bacterium]
MTVRGTAGDGGFGNDPTIPLPVVIAGSAAGTVAPRRQYIPPAYGPPLYGSRRHRGRRWLRRIAGTVMVLILLAILAFGGLLLVTPSVGNAPSLTRAQDIAHHVAYPGPPVPARFAESLVATEDHRFYSEPGIDLYAVARVGAAFVQGNGIQGGATIYQQLAKMLYTGGRSDSAKVEAEQVALAVKLYWAYSRPQILRMYADVAYFGNNDYGLVKAACGYFGVRPAEMSWPQAAMLAGMVQGPSVDDPLTHPANARAREVHVIGRLVATGKLTQAQADAALAVPLPRLVARAGQGCG